MTPRTRPLIRSATDLLGVWSTLMAPLGFAEPALWLMVVGSDGRPSPTLVEVQHRDDVPSPGHAARLAPFLRQIRLDAGGDRVAALLVRPGSGPPGLDDRDWAAVVYRAGRLGGVPLLPVHLATDDRIEVLTAADVAERLGA